MKQGNKRKTLEPKKRVGLIVVITGSGKGKTTAALGMALRAAGHHMKVCIIHFLKGDILSGEYEAFKRFAPEVEVHVAGKGYCRIRGDQHSAGEHKACAQKAIRLAKEKTASGDFDLIILDEVNNALELRLVDLPQVLDLLESKPPLMHLILTGKDAPPELIERAHTVSEVREIKHAFRQKIEPQKGVDY